MSCRKYVQQGCNIKGDYELHFVYVEMRLCAKDVVYGN